MDKFPLLLGPGFHGRKVSAASGSQAIPHIPWGKSRSKAEIPG